MNINFLYFFIVNRLFQGEKSKAKVEIYNFQTTRMATFVDYIQKLTDVYCMVAIDFTSKTIY